MIANRNLVITSVMPQRRSSNPVMHIERPQRADRINGLAIRDELKRLFTAQLEIGPFAEYFAEPSLFYSQGAPDSPGNWAALSDRTLLPLWEHHDKIYAVDLSARPTAVISWWTECPEESTVASSFDAAVFDMIELHVWEYGGGEEEAGEAVQFAEEILLPNIEQLRTLLADVESCTEEMIIDYRSRL